MTKTLKTPKAKVAPVKLMVGKKAVTVTPKKAVKAKPAKAKKSVALLPSALATGEPEVGTKPGASLVSAKYKKAYKDGNCGDTVATKIAKLIGGADEPLVALRKLAEANGVWKDDYSRLNPGMQRMNVGNRIRGLANKGETIKWSA